MVIDVRLLNDPKEKRSDWWYALIAILCTWQIAFDLYRAFVHTVSIPQHKRSRSENVLCVA